MKWRDIFLPKVRSMTEEEAKAFMNSRKVQSYQLIDVRQPREYEEGHLPGADLVPLWLLTEGGGDLDPEKPVIVYSRSGGRSKAAAEWLGSQGFKEVYNIGANIKGWLGIKVTGAYYQDLNLIKAYAEFPDAWSLAYAMEEGLQRLYLALEKGATQNEFKEMFRKLAGFEDLHKERLAKGQAIEGTEKQDPELFFKENPDLLEGGNPQGKSPMDVISEMTDVMDIFGLAMAIEAHSLDLYIRLAGRSSDPKVKELYQEMADEEKSHLLYLVKEMESYLERKE
jgi:sulfur-carrier protein adenylyltransferase/sulfurtransferase